MARAECWPNKICDAIEIALKRIDRVQDAGKWFTVPSVSRGFMIQDVIAAKKPLLRIETGDYEQTPDMASRHKGVLIVYVWCLTQAAARDSEAEINELVSDVIRAITDDETLGLGGGVEAQPVGYAPDVDAMERYQFGVARVNVRVEFTWDHGSP